MQLDHIAISGETRDAAQLYIEEALGVPLQAGGEHAVFHTHNALLGLEDGLYLEAIAINPEAPTPDRPRWFDLDRFSGAPRLTNWICATDQLSTDLAALDARMGDPVSLQRGALEWRMAVPEDGILPFDNCAPALIQWDRGDHPSRNLTARGVRLTRLTLMHPKADELQTLMSPVLADDRIRMETGPKGMSAEFITPHGVRRIEG